MEINIKTYKPFTCAMNDLKKKYGEHFAYYNGLHDDQLSFTEFIDNFIDVDTVADATIDPNANSATKDIRTLQNDMVKPHHKLLCFNKIFYELTKQYGLKTARRWLEAEWNGAFYLHNSATSTYLPYCYAYDLDDLVEKGLYCIDKFGANPAKHLTTFNNHVLEFVSWISNRSSGAVGLPSYLIYSFWFWKQDCKNGYYLKSPEYYRDQSFQEVLYNLNQPYLRVTECAFSNFTIMDREYLKEIFGGREYPDGTFVIDYIEELIEYQKAFMRVVSKTRHERMMTFPVLTFSLLFQNQAKEKLKKRHSKEVQVADSVFENMCDQYHKQNDIRLSLEDFRKLVKSDGELQKAYLQQLQIQLNQQNLANYENISAQELLKAELTESTFVDEEFAKWCVQHNMEWNDSNFYVGNDVTSLSSCCRLISNFEEMNKTKKAKGFINSIGGTSLSIGSVQVNTINLAHIAKMVKCLDLKTIDEEIQMYLKILTYYQDISLKVLHVIRHIISRNIEKGLLPNYSKGVIKLENQFCTQGITAMAEAVRELGLIEEDEFGHKTYSEKGYDFATKVLDTIQANIDAVADKVDYSINIENVPGESANVKLCQKDNELFETDLYKKLFEEI